MSTFKARGIIIKEIMVGDNDKSLIILLKDYGKFTIWAKNCRNLKSKIMAGSSLFTYADFIIYDNGKTLYINQIDIIESFYNLTEDLDTLAYGTYFLELTEKNTQEATPVNNIMLLLLKSLVLLSKGKTIPPKLIAKIFEIKFLQLNGYMPIVNNCTHCNAKIDTVSDFFWGVNGSVCKNCNHLESNILRTNSNTLYIVNQILSSDINNLYSFNVSLELLENLSLVSKKILNEHLYTNLKSKNFIEDIEDLV